MSISVTKSAVDVIIRTLSLIFANYPVLCIIAPRFSSSCDNLMMKKYFVKTVLFVLIEIIFTVNCTGVTVNAL